MQVELAQDRNDSLLDLVEVLAWRQPSALPSTWRQRYEALVEAELLALARSSEEASAIMGGVDLLPPNRRRAFLRAPVVASRVLGARAGEAFAAGPLVSSLMAELALAGIEVALAGPAWTALGDRCVAPGGGPAVGFAIPDTPIVIDWAGPVEFTESGGSRLRRLSARERDDALPNLRAAAQGIAAGASPAFALWTEGVDCVALRAAGAPGAGFSSISFAFNARVSLLVNAQSPPATAPVLVDALLHEAIHSVILMREATAPLALAEGDGDAAPTLASPWSGKPLQLSAFAHASLVWFGLAGFWARARSMGVWSAKECDVFLQRAQSGFFRRPFAALPPDQKRRLSEEASLALSDIEARMNHERRGPLSRRVG